MTVEGSLPATSCRESQPRDLTQCNERIATFFDQVAPTWETWKRRNRGYYAMLEEHYRFLIPEGSAVLEVGCGNGDLLAALRPSRGLGIDLSQKLIERARAKHTADSLEFVATAIEDVDLSNARFDAIVLSDLLGFAYDIKSVFERLAVCCHPRTRVIMNFHSRLWEPVFTVAERLRLKPTYPTLNWVTREDVAGLLHLAGFETVRTYGRIIMPKRVPLLTALCNSVLAPFWPFSHLCICNFVVARRPMRPFAPDSPPVVSVVVPCRNEAGNVPRVVERVPRLGARTELILVEGGSSDDTYERCLQAQREHRQRTIVVLQQQGKGKGDAVRLGFAHASGEVLMILDADMTVRPEDLPQFFAALESGRAELVNGSRLVYAMETQAMQFLNLVANKLFGWAFSFLLDQRVKDTLCGTKVLLRSDYELIAARRADFGTLDPFGDFDLLFGAARSGLKILDLPIRYRDRSYGTTNISRFRHGLLLLRMCLVALRRLKCR